MKQFITDYAELKKYRIELPNLYDDAGLDVYEFRLLAHYKRVGTCTEGANTTAEICGMSKGRVSRTRQTLAAKGFIQLAKVTVPGGFAYSVTVIDMWFENFLKYSKLTYDEAMTKLQASMNEKEGSRGEPQGSRGDDKEESTTKGIVNSSTIYKSYTDNIGILTPMVADDLKHAEKEYPELWITDAIKLAVKNNKRNWRYCEAILRRWKADGKDNGEGKPKSGYVGKKEKAL